MRYRLQVLSQNFQLFSRNRDRENVPEIRYRAGVDGFVFSPGFLPQATGSTRPKTGRLSASKKRAVDIFSSSSSRMSRVSCPPNPDQRTFQQREFPRPP